MSDENIKGIPEEETAELQEEISEETTEETTEEISEETSEDTAEEAAEETADNSAEETDEETEKEIDEENLCPYCGEKEKAEDSDYCSECEAAMLSRKIPFLAWIGALVAVVVSVFALALVFLLTAPAIQVAKADESARENRWYSAYEEYQTVATVVDEISSILGSESPFIKTGTGLTVRKFNALANYTTPIDAFVLDGTSVEHLRDKYCPKLKTHFEFYNGFAAASDAISPLIKENFSSEENPDAEKVHAFVEELRGTEGVEDIWIDYFHLLFTYDFNESDEIKLGYLKAIDESAKKSDLDYSWLYYYEMANFLYKDNDYEGASERLDTIIAKDKTNFGAYELKTRILLKTKGLDETKKLVDEFIENNEGYDTAYILEIMYLRCAKEYDKAVVLCNEALEEYGSSPEINRQLALVYLLKGDYDKAYDTVYIAFNNAQYIYQYYQDGSSITDQLLNTVYLCAYLESEFGSMTAENTADIGKLLIDLSQFAETECVADIISGKKTVEQVLTEGEFDLI